jgi:hypothetical protein
MTNGDADAHASMRAAPRAVPARGDKLAFISKP